MRRLVLLSLLFSSLWLAAAPIRSAQRDACVDFRSKNLPPEGERARFTAYIELPKAYISGVCILVNDEGLIKGSLFNEFGVSALDFTYNPERKKVKLHHVMKMMDKWYIRYVLRKDLAQLMQRLQQGETSYENQRRHIKYTLIKLKE